MRNSSEVGVRTKNKWGGYIFLSMPVSNRL